jgi:hypothetical protein
MLNELNSSLEYVIINIPTTAIRILITLYKSTFFLKNRKYKYGTSTIFNCVINPFFDAVVKTFPNV